MGIVILCTEEKLTGCELLGREDCEACALRNLVLTELVFPHH